MPGKTLWIDTNFSTDVVVGTQLQQSLMGVVQSDESRLVGMTLMRTIIRMDIAYTVHDSGEGSQRLSMGIGVASQEAFNAGVLPEPFTDGDFPTRGWIWRATYRLFGFAADQPAIYNRALDIDLRSRRKLENGEAYLVADNVNLEGVSSTVRVLGGIRQLWLVT